MPGNHRSGGQNAAKLPHNQEQVLPVSKVWPWRKTNNPNWDTKRIFQHLYREIFGDIKGEITLVMLEQLAEMEHQRLMLNQRLSNDPLEDADAYGQLHKINKETRSIIRDLGLLRRTAISAGKAISEDDKKAVVLDFSPQTGEE